ncbi:MAG: T9SS type A sorting domain-containing protein [Saprospiraceae bacterium]|jgi:hypothetical protein|nr:T9SS type A sorting domain-containing protein [Saprospiraceae bacterium]
MRYIIFLLLFILLSESITAQQPFFREKRDYVWMFGYDTTIQLNGKNNWLDFNDTPVSTHERPGTMSIDITNAGICDTAGNLLFYTNGFVVMNGNHEILENGEGLNPGVMTNDWVPYGQPLCQGALLLPLSESNSIYYLFHGRIEYLFTGIDIYDNISKVFPLYYSVVTINSGEGADSILEKNSLLVNDTLSFGQITAVRHANGRDWWIIVFNYFANTYHRFLLHPQGISELSIQSVGDSIPSGIGQAVFSPDGARYAKLNSHKIGQDVYLDVYNFDRCNGLLSNAIHIVYRDTSLHGGVAFSPNSRFLYVSSDRYVYQYDLQAQDIEASKTVITAVPPVSGETDFALAQLGPDQKVYISGYTIKALHIIHNPNAAGTACNFEKEALTFSHFLGRSIPNHPCYDLGPLDGSPCDTLGIDNHPQAAFRHQEQALEVTFWDYSLFAPTQWQWDFGDGTAGSTQQNPVHLYVVPGIYQVCLTVSNANNSDTHCEWIEVITTGTYSPYVSSLNVRVYPNPARNVLQIDIANSTPVTIALLDMYGRVLLSQQAGEAPLGQNLTIDISSLNNGIYLLELSGMNINRQVVRIVIMK